MVDMSKAKQFQGFDFNDYTFIDTSANPFGPAPPGLLNNIGIYVAGTDANAPLISTIQQLMVAIPAPAPGSPPTDIGPQFPWPYEGSLPFPAALPGFAAIGLTNPLNVAPVQKTLIRVVTNDMYVYFLDLRLATFLYALLFANPMLPLVPPVPLDTNPGTFAAPLWPVPRPVLLEADVGLYEFERKWIWLLYARAVADADADLHVYMEG